MIKFDYNFILAAMYCFKSLSECSTLVRAYALKHCYEEARLF